MSLRFGLIGAAGYVAPRHMEAIKDIGGELVAACDNHDSVGILDKYFPDCEFFRDSAEFFSHCQGRVDYISVCTPNYLHEAHCLMGLDAGADVICEKPLVMKNSDIDVLYRAMIRTGHSVWPILQLRLHPAVVNVKSEISTQSMHDVKVEYHTPRGRWYDESWKGNPQASGGIARNIGIHLFDLCYYLFGAVQNSAGVYSSHIATGSLKLKHANVDWALSIDRDEEPCRMFVIDGHRIDLTGGFDLLHEKMYAFIVAGKSWSIDSARPAIQICEELDAAW